MTAAIDQECYDLIRHAHVGVAVQPDGSLLLNNLVELGPYESCLGNYLVNGPVKYLNARSWRSVTLPERGTV
jgi:hypothetical protein|tara:strand:- start:557 stop:772 length:216 start_codon:yes stop_codon:yes gene_type:complete